VDEEDYVEIGVVKLFLDLVAHSEMSGLRPLAGERELRQKSHNFFGILKSNIQGQEEKHKHSVFNFRNDDDPQSNHCL
jgi:hypothetical protein